MKYSYESNNREPLPIGWDWAANSLHIAFPPPLIRGMRTGPPAPITTIGEACRARRQRILEARANKEVCQRRAIQDKTPGLTKEKSNTMEIDTPPKAPNVKGTGKSIPPAPTNSWTLSKDAKNGNVTGKAKEQYISKKGKSPFNLADVVPEPSKEDPSIPQESRRGFRRPKETPATQHSNWEENSKWPSRNDWKEE